MSEVVRKESEATPMQQRNQTLERFLQPRSSVMETPDSVVLELEMPGCGRDNVEIWVENDELTVTGTRCPEDLAGVEVLHQERLLLNFRRSFVLSERIDSTRIGASYQDGVLSLTLPKTETAKPKKITIE